jgi:hypothetical protein
MVNIRTSLEFSNIIKERVIKPLLEYLSMIAVKKLQEELDTAEISTNTMKRYVRYQLNSTNTQSEIYIDYYGVQEEAEPPIYGAGGRIVEWGRFVSLDGSSTYSGMPISFQMIDWLENGSNGNIGNQPIHKVGMFEKTAQYLQTNLPQLIRNFLKKYE